MAGMRQGEVSAARWADVRRGRRGRRATGAGDRRPPDPEILAHCCNLGLYTMEKVAPDIAYRRHLPPRRQRPLGRRHDVGQRRATLRHAAQGACRLFSGT